MQILPLLIWVILGITPYTEKSDSTPELPQRAIEDSMNKYERIADLEDTLTIGIWYNPHVVGLSYRILGYYNNQLGMMGFNCNNDNKYTNPKPMIAFRKGKIIRFEFENYKEFKKRLTKVRKDYSEYHYYVLDKRDSTLYAYTHLIRNGEWVDYLIDTFYKHTVHPPNPYLKPGQYVCTPRRGLIGSFGDTHFFESGNHIYELFTGNPLQPKVDRCYKQIQNDTIFLYTDYPIHENYQPPILMDQCITPDTSLLIFTKLKYGKITQYKDKRTDKKYCP